jgi:Bacterial protein of unknown function (DUF899)
MPMRRVGTARRIRDLHDRGFETLAVERRQLAGECGSRAGRVVLRRAARLQRRRRRDNERRHTGGNLAVVAKAPIVEVETFARDRGWKHIRLLSTANSSFRRDYGGENADPTSRLNMVACHSSPTSKRS